MLSIRSEELLRGISRLPVSIQQRCRHFVEIASENMISKVPSLIFFHVLFEVYCIRARSRILDSTSIPSTYSLWFSVSIGQKSIPPCAFCFEIEVFIPLHRISRIISNFSATLSVASFDMGKFAFKIGTVYTSSKNF